jgi:RDD family
MEPNRPSYAMAAAAGDGGPYPWRRYFARTLDSLWFVPLSGFVLGAGFTLLLSKEEAELFFDIPDLVLGLILFALWLPIEALFISGTGTTPAKWLFGIHVEGGDGRRLRFGAAAERTVRVWFQGLGAGIPIVSLITLLFAYKRLNSTGTTLWDTAVGSRVRHSDWTAIRALLCIVLILLFSGFVVALGVLAARAGS